MYIFVCPSWWVEADSPFFIFIPVSQNIYTLKPSPISNSQSSIGFTAFEPIPDLTQHQTYCSCYCKCIDVKVFFVLYLPVLQGPDGHSIGHWSCAVSNSASKAFGAIEHPLCQSQCHFRQFLLLRSPVEGQRVLSWGWRELLKWKADVSEDLSLDRIGKISMVLNLVNSSEAEVSRSHCLLYLRGQLYDWDEESSWCDLQNLKSWLLL